MLALVRALSMAVVLMPSATAQRQPAPQPKPVYRSIPVGYGDYIYYSPRTSAAAIQASLVAAATPKLWQVGAFALLIGLLRLARRDRAQPATESVAPPAGASLQKAA